ncbi:hypothetical protein KR222_001600, partial [Zaprionus bogoriensis]
ILTVSGWGLTLEEKEILAKRAVAITLWEREKCSDLFPVDSKHLCAVQVGKNSCNGDSGGPLMHMFQRRRMVLEGIVSYGIRNCSNTDFPGVYTRVRSYEQWLNEKMVMQN